MKKVLCSLILVLGLAGQLSAIDLIFNTARAFVIDMPALSSTDGVTPQVGLTVTSFTVNVYKKDKARVNVPITACAYASATLNSSGSNPANNDLLTIAGGTYTYKTTLTGASYEIKIAASAALTLDNTKCAINDSGCAEGTDYGTGTAAHPVVNATTNTDTSQVVVANIPGTTQNAFTVSETSSQLSWSTATLTGANDNCMIHDANGYYWFAGPSTLFDTRGDIKLTFNITGAAPFAQLGKVVASSSNDINVEGNVTTALGIWDIQTTALDDTGSVGKRVNDNLNATVSSRATPGDVTGGLNEGNAQAGTATTITLASGASTIDDYYRKKTVSIKSGTGIGQEAVITGYVGSTRVATIWNPAKTDGTWHTNPDTSSFYLVNRAVIGSLGAPIAEPTQVTPPVTPTPEQAMGYYYSTVRNRVDEDAATKKFYNDAGVVTWKKNRSASGNVKTEGEAVAGP